MTGPMKPTTTLLSPHEVSEALHDTLSRSGSQWAIFLRNTFAIVPGSLQVELFTALCRPLSCGVPFVRAWREWNPGIDVLQDPARKHYALVLIGAAHVLDPEMHRYLDAAVERWINDRDRRDDAREEARFR